MKKIHLFVFFLPLLPLHAEDELRLEGERWTYREGDREVTGILVKPEGDGPFPAVLISHGRGGSGVSFGLQKAREMVAWGFVCIAPDYTHAGPARGAGGKGKAPGALGIQPPAGDLGASAENLRRAKTCLDLLAKMPEVDPVKIAAYGHSMGGFVTIALAATEPDRIGAAAITGSGVSPHEGFPAPPVSAAAKIKTPFLILHGDADPVVRPEQSAALAAALKTAGIAHERVLYPGEGHPIDQTKREEVFAAVRRWFAKQGVK
jgi:dipeptidyl aminopeptidase/acylaminoacyl peptidase